ncbi:MAG: Gfo/Idh/MocA family oxidoreductase [Thermomicrobiales bacterium]
MADLLRVGIVGAGGISNVHSVGWNSYPDKAVIAAYCDVATDRAQGQSDKYTGGKAKVYGSIDDLAADPDIDVFDICLPHHLHTPAILAGAKAGKAILCEKPLTTSLDDAITIQNAVAESGVTFMGAHNNLFYPSLLEARRLLDGGILGKPFFLRAIETFQSRRFDPWTPGSADKGGDQRGWRADLKQAGGGELLDTGYHSTYRLLSLANGDRPVEVFGMLSRFLLQHLPTEDTGQVLVRFESGVVGEIITSWAFDVVGARHFEVSAELGSLAGGPNYLDHQLYRWPEPTRRTFDPIHSFTQEIGHFIDMVQSGAANAAPMADTIRTLQVIKGAYLSAKEGQWVTLPEDPTGAPVVRSAAASTAYSVEVPEEVVH